MRRGRRMSWSGRLAQGRTPSSAIFAWRTVRLHPWEVRVGADVSSAHAERSSAAPCGLLGGQSRLGKGSTAQDAIGKGMTFTRARHNPLSLVILNERRFCASEGPRRAARCLAFFARQYSRVRHASLSSSGKAPPAETPERSRRDTRGICFSPSLNLCTHPQLKNPPPPS